MDDLTLAYYKVKYPLTEAEQKELDEGLAGMLAGGFGVWDYYELRKQGYTHLEAMAKAATQAAAGWAGAGLGSGLGPLGTIGGGYAGYEGGGWLYDKLTGRVNGRVPGSKAVLGGKPVVWGKDGRWEYPDGTPAQDEEGQTIAPPAGTPTQREQDIEDLQTGTSDSPVETAAGLYQQDGEQEQDQEIGDGEEPVQEPQQQTQEPKLTPMQQWAKKFPKLAAKVKPGQAGYDEIQAMGQGQAPRTAADLPRNTGQVPAVDLGREGIIGAIPRQQSSEPASPSVAQRGQIDDATEKMRKNQEKYKDDLLKARQKQQIDREIKTPGVRAASKINDYSGKLKQVGNNVGKAFAGIPESYMHKMQEDAFAKVDLLFEEVGVEEMSGEELTERFGAQFLSKFLRRAPQGWKWVTKNGKRLLQRVTGKKPPVKAPPKKPGGVTTTDGKLIDPKTGKPFPRTKPGKSGTKPGKGGGKKNKPGKNRERPQVDPPDLPQAQGQRRGFPWRTAGNIASVGAGIAGGKYIWDNKDKIKNWLTGGGDEAGTDPGTQDPGTDPSTQVQQPPVVQQPVVEPKDTEAPDPQISAPQTQAPKPPSSGRSSWRRPTGRLEMRNANIARSMARREEVDLDGLMDELMETPKGDKGLSVEAKVVKRNLRDGDDATPAATARRQFRSAALRGVKKPKPVKSPRKETRMPGEQLKDMKENRLTPEALDAAAGATLKKHKEQGYKVHSTDSMKDVIDRLKGKKGQV